MGEPVGTDTIAEVTALCDAALDLTAGSELEVLVVDVRDRLLGPFRVAIAGRVNAGKSTLLNALVGERIAATDAGECTKIITAVHRAAGYEVAAVGHDGSRSPLKFRRDDRRLEVDLTGTSADAIARLDIGWPANVLDDLTLVDTPGLDSLRAENSRRTLSFLEHDSTNPAQADAAIYVMRHLHHSDAEFLGAFMDRAVAGCSPVNAVAVLSRADEIGASRPDAMESAQRIADRYRADPAIGALVGDIVPVAGLVAETGLTLSEGEFRSIAELAAMSADDRRRLCLSVDDFCDVESTSITSEIRSELLARFGIFGVRRAIEMVASGSADDASQLSRALVEISGVANLQQVIRARLLPRARLLKARTALLALRGVARRLSDAGSPEAAGFSAAVDRVEAGAFDVAILHAAHLVMSGAVRLSAADAAEVEHALDAEPARGLGIVGDTVEQRQEAALLGLVKWRERSNDPLADTATMIVADAMARLFEQLYVTA